ncbi:MAG: MBOAT family protein [Candidatus Latescibacteria bacterium]|nr:MBOAT family protein [Candidatus Latescibacterota bacterium]
MIFTEPFFLFFFLPILLSCYYFVGIRAQNVLLVAASLFFYAYGESYYLLLLLFSCCFNYLIARWMDGYETEKIRRYFLGLGISGNVGMLALFKYADFVVENINQLMTILGGVFLIPSAGLHLPIGISFYTFQALTYLIDVYRRQARAQSGIMNVCLYISLFPQLIAGPIVRYSQMASQIYGRVSSLENVTYGIRRFIIGLAKKVVIANTLATASDAIFAIPFEHLTPSLAWLGIFCYTLQIYYDFASYSDMAIGIGLMLGFRFPENFNYPYAAVSVTDFWRRWHMTLSSWFRDYVYIPLGGNRQGRSRLYLNLILVFFACGLWHGASWNFVIWGLLHGSVLVIERHTGGHGTSVQRTVLRQIYVWGFLMSSFVVFRTESMIGASRYLFAMIGAYSGTGVEYHPGLYLNTPLILIVGIAVLGCWPILPALKEHLEQAIPKRVSRGWVDFGTYSALLAVLGITISFMSAQSHVPFIYFRF